MMHLLVELPQYSFKGDQDHQLYYKTLCHLFCKPYVSIRCLPLSFKVYVSGWLKMRDKQPVSRKLYNC